MRILSKLFKKEGSEEEAQAIMSSEDTITTSIQNKDIPDSLDLGWYYSDGRNEFQMAKISQKDRATHFYVIGATGTGKTKFLEFLINQDIEKRNGFGVIDPHGDLIEETKGLLAYHFNEKELSERVVIIDPTDPRYTVTFNPLEKQAGVSIPEAVNEIISSFRKIWSDAWGVRMEDLFRNSLIALSEAGLTLIELPSFLSKRAFRGYVLKKTVNPITKEYFERFDTMTDRGQITWIEPVMNKINALFADERIREIFSSPKSSFNIREIMDQRKVLLIKLDKGKLKDSSDLLGSLLLAKIQMAAFSRGDLSQDRRIPFYLYIDEFQNFASDTFGIILSEARKYGLSLIMAHQSLAQISLELKSLILGNTGIQVYFRLNRQDANLLAKEGFDYSGYEVKSLSLNRTIFWSYAEEWEHKIEELQNLSPRICYIKHKIEGGIIPIQTVEIEPLYELLGIEEDRYQEFINNLPFGRRYLIPREELATISDHRQRFIIKEVGGEKEEKPSEIFTKILPVEQGIKKEKIRKTEAAPSGNGLLPEEMGFLKFISQNPGMFITQIYKELDLSGYKGDRIKEDMINKGLIIQEETRDGRGGRLAKVLVLTDEGRKSLKVKSLKGKGGDLHKNIQQMIKEQAELYGWKAKIEERLHGSLESVDVGLMKGDMKVAVEVSDTTKPQQETPNIKKCLEVGYDYILCVSSDERRLSLLKIEVKKSFMAQEREKIRFYHPSMVKDFLSGVGSVSIVSEKGIVSDKISKEKQLLNTEETSEFLGISRHTLYEWVVQKKIPYVKVGRLTKFRRVDLEGWLTKRSQAEDRRDFL